MSKLVLARGNITNTDGLVIILSEPDNRTGRGTDPLARSGLCGVPCNLPDHR
jgi:hypothetical protein